MSCAWCEAGPRYTEITARARRAAKIWKPIATAPKDGTRIMLLLHDGEVITARWRETKTGRPWINTKRGFCWGEFTPTHWSPLVRPC